MVVIIDGHNLIPKVEGISLSDIDDEEKLIQLLQEFSRIQRKTVEVFFDGAPAGWAGTRRYGLVKAHFIRKTSLGNAADRAIIAYLKKQKKGAKNMTVVSSDGSIVVAARSMQAEVISSEDFAKHLKNLRESKPEVDPRQQPLTKEEIKDWVQFFNQGSKKDDGVNQ